MEDIKVTTLTLWTGTLLFAIIDAGYVPFLSWKIKPAKFLRLKRTLVLTTAVFWCALWTWAVFYYWDSVYRYVFPDWARWLVPPAQGLLAVGVSLLMWRIAISSPGKSVLLFCILGGLWGMITHIFAVQRGIVNKPPMMAGASPTAAVIVAIFEFIFYWCVILSIASILYSADRWWASWRENRLHHRNSNAQVG